MGIFKKLFGEIIKIDHPFFGTMLYSERKGKGRDGYFECRRTFQPSNSIIEIGIDAEPTGPTQDQIDFFRKVEANYLTISNLLIPQITASFSDWKEDFKIIDFQNEFEPVYLMLPKLTASPTKWEICFETAHDRNHTVTVSMEDFTPIDVLIDG